jgi:hypothetical protein
MKHMNHKTKHPFHAACPELLRRPAGQANEPLNGFEGS